MEVFVVVRGTRWFLILLFLVSSLFSHLFLSQVIAQDRSNLGDIYREKFLHNEIKPSSRSYSIVIPPPLSLKGGSSLSILYPKQWQNLAENIKSTILIAHDQFSEMFGKIPSFSSSIRLMDEESFYLSTGAPSWTNALFYKGQILIPVPEKGKIDLENIVRSVKHEYTHAVINALSDGKCPGWLDEGLAQWAEGSENPALRPALSRYLKNNQPVSLNLLQNGFTKLETRMVPAAYAQSLFATQTMISSYGLPSIAKYLRNLRDGEEKSEAFSNTFELAEYEFETYLAKGLGDWARVSHNHN